MSHVPAVLLVCALALTVQAQAGRRVERPGRFDTYAWILKTYDKDGDGHVSAKEYPRGAARFSALDRNGDGVLDARDGEAPAAQRERRDEKAVRGAAPQLEVGALAPALTATALDGKTEFRLADWRGKKPVALIFGSWT